MDAVLNTVRSKQVIIVFFHVRNSKRFKKTAITSFRFRASKSSEAHVFQKQLLRLMALVFWGIEGIGYIVDRKSNDSKYLLPRDRYMYAGRRLFPFSFGLSPGCQFRISLTVNHYSPYFRIAITEITAFKSFPSLHPSIPAIRGSNILSFRLTELNRLFYLLPGQGVFFIIAGLSDSGRCRAASLLTSGFCLLAAF